MAHFINNPYLDETGRSIQRSHTSTPSNNLPTSITGLTTHQLYGPPPLSMPIPSAQASRRGSLRPGLDASLSALHVAATPHDAALELERALQRSVAMQPSIQASRAANSGSDEYSSFNPFSLSNSNSTNTDNWDSEPDFSVLPTSPEARNITLPNPHDLSLPPIQLQPQQQPQSSYNMDPNEQNQFYYHPQPAYPQYAHSYATSSGPSNPTSPQNGYVPIYSDTNAPTIPPQSTPLYQPYTAPASEQSPQTLEEHELKRLRNTAASARFRAKKKQREAQLETAARDKKERLEALEKRIHDLEEENKWLKALIMEKKDVAGEVARLRERFGRVEEEMREFDGESKDGVGTSASASGKGKEREKSNEVAK